MDLWSADATKEVNLVRHSATSPSISATTSVSYPPNADISEALPQPPQYLPPPLPQMPQMPQMSQMPQIPLPPVYCQPQQMPPTSAPMFSHIPTAYQQHPYAMQQVSQPYGPPPPPILTHQPQQYWMAGTPTPITPTGQFGPGQGPLLSPSALSTQSCDPRSQPSGMFTRNLIGSLCVSAFKLTDPENNLGVWFILQDLSVRTEGSFR